MGNDKQIGRKYGKNNDRASKGYSSHPSGTPRKSFGEGRTAEKKFDGKHPFDTKGKTRDTRQGKPFAEKKFAQPLRDAAPEADFEAPLSAPAKEQIENGAVIGRNAVRELLKSGRTVDKLLVQKGERTGSITVLVATAIGRKIPVIEVEKAKLDAMADFAPHQGIIALAAEKEYCTPEDILQIAKNRGEAPLIVLCDGITDPYNLGAIIRSAECCGAHGLIISKRRAVGLTPLVSKASAGAIEHLAIAKVANIATTLEFLKEQGIWTFAAEAGGESIYQTDFKGGCALVLGSEGDGVSQLVKKTCDAVVSIPMYGQINSFNVSNAAAVLLSEVARQHHNN